MAGVTVSREMFLEDIQGRTFSDVLNDPEQPFTVVLEFFNDENRQRRMEESEFHHDRPPLAGVVRELEADPEINRFLAEIHTRRSTRLRQAIGVLVRMIMEARGWRQRAARDRWACEPIGIHRNPSTTRVGWHSGSFEPSVTNMRMVCRSGRCANVARSRIRSATIIARLTDHVSAPRDG